MLLAILIWVITIVTMVLFSIGRWTFPIGASTHAARVDNHYYVVLVICGIIFFMAQMGLGWVLFRYRDRSGGRAIYSHGNNRLELIWTVATAVIFFALNIMGQKVWADLRFRSAPPDAVK